MSPKVPLVALIVTLSLAACRRENRAVTTTRPTRVAPPSATDIENEKRDEILKDLVAIPALGTGVNFQTPDGENWVRYRAGILIHELKRTDETEAKFGQLVAIAYTLTTPGVEKPIEKRDAANPFTFNLGTKNVVKGMNMGVLGMRVGGRRRIFLPPELAYGKPGNPGGNIGPDQALIFEIELLSVTGESFEPPATIPVPSPIGPPAPTTATSPADRVTPVP